MDMTNIRRATYVTSKIDAHAMAVPFRISGDYYCEPQLSIFKRILLSLEESERKIKLGVILKRKQLEIEEKLKQLPKRNGSLRLQKTLKYERAMLSPSKPLNPPTLGNTRLQEFIQRAYTKLKASINGKIQSDQVSVLAMIRQFSENNEAAKHLQEDIADLVRDLRSLYQWIREEDKEVSQEALECLLQTLVSSFWLSVYLSEESHRGGFRNLLLDGWWLEFWEIILLAAGDVERNPGPRQITDEELAKVSDIPIGKLMR